MGAVLGEMTVMLALSIAPVPSWLSREILLLVRGFVCDDKSFPITGFSLY